MKKKNKVYQDNTDKKIISRCAEILNDGGVVIYPTDSVYAIGVSLLSSKGVEKLHKIKKVKKGQHDFSLICNNISMISEYVKQLSQAQFKILKKNLPGPFTFILETNKTFPRKLSLKRKTIGVRIPNNSIPRQISEMLNHPILTTSLKNNEEEAFNDYLTDPDIIYQTWGDKVDLFLDNGMGNNEGSTVVELIDDEPIIIRASLGQLLY